MSRPLKEATTYLVVAFTIALGLAVALPPPFNMLLSAMAPVTALSSSPSPPLRGESAERCGPASA